MSNGLVNGMPGGSLKTSVTTSEVYMDLTALAGYEVMIWSDDQDLWFSWSASAAGTIVTGSDTAASTTALVGHRVGASFKAFRVVRNATPFLVVKTASGTTTVRVTVARGPL